MLCRLLGLAVVLVVSLSAVVADATLMSFTTLNDQATEPTLDASGNVVLAYNFTPSSGSVVDQGITFTDVTTTSSTSSITFGTTDGITVSGTQPGTNNWGNANLGGAGDPWKTFIWSSSGVGTITASGLNPAKTYKFQFLSGDTRSTTPADQDYMGGIFQFTATVADSSNNTLSGTASWNSWTGGSDQLSTVVAYGTTTLSYALSSPVSNGCSFSGVVISEVPEPSCAVILVTALVGLFCYAWRKRK